MSVSDVPWELWGFGLLTLAFVAQFALLYRSRRRRDSRRRAWEQRR